RLARPAEPGVAQLRHRRADTPGRRHGRALRYRLRDRCARPHAYRAELRSGSRHGSLRVVLRGRTRQCRQAGHEAVVVMVGRAGAAAAVTAAALLLAGCGSSHGSGGAADAAAPAPSWKLVTPVAVADNGGLVVATTGPQSLVTGFRPSQDLTFSPITATSD